MRHGVAAVCIQLVAARAQVQLLLGAPFAPASSGAEVLLDVIDELRDAVARDALARDAGGGVAAGGGAGGEGGGNRPLLLCWRAVARLPLPCLCAALEVAEAHAYEVDAPALGAWAEGRGAALQALLAALDRPNIEGCSLGGGQGEGRGGGGRGGGDNGDSEGHGGGHGCSLSLGWLRPMATDDAMGALLALPAVRQAGAPRAAAWTK